MSSSRRYDAVEDSIASRYKERRHKVHRRSRSRSLTRKRHQHHESQRQRHHSRAHSGTPRRHRNTRSRSHIYNGNAVESTVHRKHVEQHQRVHNRTRTRSRSGSNERRRRISQQHKKTKTSTSSSKRRSRSRTPTRHHKQHNHHHSSSKYDDDENKMKKSKEHYPSKSHISSKSSTEMATLEKNNTNESGNNKMSTTTKGKSNSHKSSKQSAVNDSQDKKKEPTIEATKKNINESNETSSVGAYYNLDVDEPFDKERIHREIEAKLREALAKEGKVYPPPKQEASHPVFANDGSFLEIFKKMQKQQQQQPIVPRQPVVMQITPMTTNILGANSTAAILSQDIEQLQHHQTVNSILPLAAPPLPPSLNIASGTSNNPQKAIPTPPIVGRRRGGKILKTGVVAKPKAQTEKNIDPKDFWSLYLAEVNKYKNTACETDGGKRPLVK